MTGRPQKKGQVSKDSDDGEEIVVCAKCGCAEFGAVAQEVNGKKEYQLKCRKCGTISPHH